MTVEELYELLYQQIKLGKGKQPVTILNEQYEVLGEVFNTTDGFYAFSIIIE